MENFGGAGIVIYIVEGYGYSDPSSNPVRGYLNFI